MAESIKVWRSQPPPPFCVADAVRDPLRHLCLASWQPLSSLRRGAQFGRVDFRSVWAIGLARFPHEWEKASPDDRRRTRVGPLALINPGAFSALVRVGTDDPAWRIAERLAQLDLLIPAGARCLTWPARVPGSGRLTHFYTLRGSLAFIDPAGVPPGVAALAAVVRSHFAGYWPTHPMPPLVPDPSFRYEPYKCPRAAQRRVIEEKARRAKVRKPKRDDAAPDLFGDRAAEQLALAL